MNKPKTPTEALHQCEILWKALAENGGDIETKYRVANEVLGYDPYAACPACEYAFEPTEDDPYNINCRKCPIDAWRQVSENDNNGCYADGSPYLNWVRNKNPTHWARKVLKLIRTSKAYNADSLHQDM